MRENHGPAKDCGEGSDVVSLRFLVLGFLGVDDVNRRSRRRRRVSVRIEGFRSGIRHGDANQWNEYQNQEEQGLSLRGFEGHMRHHVLIL